MLQLTCNCMFGISNALGCQCCWEGQVQRGKSCPRVFAAGAVSSMLILSATGPVLSPHAALAGAPGILLAESNSSSERQPGKGMDADLEAKLDELAAVY